MAIAYSSRACTRRVKATVSQIKAGYMLIPPSAGRTICVTDAHMRAIGGTVGAATSIDLQASTTGTVVVTGTPANMTVAAGILRVSATGMDAGAGFNADLPHGEGVKLITVGSAATTATHVEVVVEYG